MLQFTTNIDFYFVAKWHWKTKGAGVEANVTQILHQTFATFSPKVCAFGGRGKWGGEGRGGGVQFVSVCICLCLCLFKNAPVSIVSVSAVVGWVCRIIPSCFWKRFSNLSYKPQSIAFHYTSLLLTSENIFKLVDYRCMIGEQILFKAPS